VHRHFDLKSVAVAAILALGMPGVLAASGGTISTESGSTITPIINFSFTQVGDLLIYQIAEPSDPTILTYTDPGGAFQLTGDVIIDTDTDAINYSFHAENVTSSLGFILDFSAPVSTPTPSETISSDITANGTSATSGFTSLPVDAAFIVASAAASESSPTGLNNGSSCSVPGDSSNTCDFAEVLDTLSSAPNNPLNVEIDFSVPAGTGSGNDFGVNGDLEFVPTPEPCSFRSA
jgi:hypothetical protein